MATIIRPDGTTAEFDYVNASLKDLQAVVSGNIQMVNMPDDHGAIVCNEEGKLLGLPLNIPASDQYMKAWGMPKSFDVLMGTVIFVTIDELAAKE